jgi:hypothetical protein
MAKKVFKAKMYSDDYEHEAIIKIGKKWRLFGTPVNLKSNQINTANTAQGAKRSAEATANALGITLEWEG